MARSSRKRTTRRRTKKRNTSKTYDMKNCSKFEGSCLPIYKQIPNFLLSGSRIKIWNSLKEFQESVNANNVFQHKYDLIILKKTILGTEIAKPVCTTCGCKITYLGELDKRIYTKYPAFKFPIGFLEPLTKHTLVTNFRSTYANLKDFITQIIKHLDVQVTTEGHVVFLSWFEHMNNKWGIALLTPFSIIEEIPNYQNKASILTRDVIESTNMWLTFLWIKNYSLIKNIGEYFGKFKIDVSKEVFYEILSPEDWAPFAKPK